MVHVSVARAERLARGQSSKIGRWWANRHARRCSTCRVAIERAREDQVILDQLRVAFEPARPGREAEMATGGSRN
jgi:hypothetical protein